MRAWLNLWLGVGYTRRGNTPEWERLFERREAGLERGVVPAGAGLLVIACDVQQKSIYWSCVGLRARSAMVGGRLRRCEGDTDVADAGAFVELDKLYQSKVADQFGKSGARR